MLRLHITISGKVQGVGFRYQIQQKAREKEIAGWVRNLPSGEVEIVAEGTEEKVNQFLDWCKRGPLYGKVNKILTRKEKYTAECTGFEVRYS